jgi:5-(carboxyamino)imidazole ribonucleotide mutase
MKAAIIFGSASDRAVMEKAAAVLRDFGIEYSSHIISAHRAPELLAATVKKLEDEGAEVFIAGAGLAAHLPGVIASMTAVPVVGVPIASGGLSANSGLGGLDALLSIVQMPKGVPVATVGVDNAANAAYLAAEMLSIKYDELKTKLKNFRIKMKEDLERNSAGGL